MRCKRPLAVAVPFLLVGALAAPAAASPDLARTMLAIHNGERAKWNVPPLEWDPGLASGADVWAIELSRSGGRHHSPKAWRPRQGENLAFGTRGYFSIAQMAGTWLAERADFRPGIFPAVSRTGNWLDVGHYTQMISRRSLRVGCAARGGPRQDVLVCRYSPSGNVDGRAMP